jgi:hypothetical protein
VKLDPVLADRILESVRGHLPPEVTITRRGSGVLRVRARWERFGDEVSRQLRSDDTHWPGLDYGPVEILCRIEGDDIHAEIVDRHGTRITLAPVATRT